MKFESHAGAVYWYFCGIPMRPELPRRVDCVLAFPEGNYVPVSMTIRAVRRIWWPQLGPRGSILVTEAAY